MHKYKILFAICLVACLVLAGCQKVPPFAASVTKPEVNNALAGLTELNKKSEKVVESVDVELIKIAEAHPDMQATTQRVHTQVSDFVAQVSATVKVAFNIITKLKNDNDALATELIKAKSDLGILQDNYGKLDVKYTGLKNDYDTQFFSHRQRVWMWWIGGISVGSIILILILNSYTSLFVGVWKLGMAIIAIPLDWIGSAFSGIATLIHKAKDKAA